MYFRQMQVGEVMAVLLPEANCTQESSFIVKSIASHIYILLQNKHSSTVLSQDFQYQAKSQRLLAREHKQFHALGPITSQSIVHWYSEIIPCLLLSCRTKAASFVPQIDGQSKCLFARPQMTKVRRYTPHSQVFGLFTFILLTRQMFCVAENL